VRAAVARREVRVVARLAAIGLAALVVLNSRSLFVRLGSVGHPAAVWLTGAIAAEIASLLAYSLLVRELLRLGGVTTRFRSFVRPALVGTAMTASLPAGVGASNVYWFKQLRRHGADNRLAALVMTGTSIAGAISLLGLLAVGVALAGPAGPVAHVYGRLLAVAAAALMPGSRSRTRSAACSRARFGESRPRSSHATPCGYTACARPCCSPTRIGCVTVQRCICLSGRFTRPSLPAA
jgi:hypothetical protein